MIVFTDTIYITYDDEKQLEAMEEVVRRSGYKWTVRNWKHGKSFTARRVIREEKDNEQRN